MGENSLLELYLFINPIGSTCYHSEQIIMKLATELQNKIRFRFIPFLNLATTASMMEENSIPLNDLSLRNQVYHQAYQASLDYKAALFQGKKCGRKFLLDLQHEIVDKNSIYSEELVHQIAVNCNLDHEMFNHDRHSEFTINSFHQDMQMAAEMNVETFPTIVVYNLNGVDCGVSLTECTSYQLLSDLCTGKMNDLLGEPSRTKQSRNHSNPNLHIL